MNRLHGWLLIDKPAGPTSAGVVGKLRHALRAAGWPDVKIGHGGTLDPLATGLLPIALGEATKLSGLLLNGPKAYRFTLAFGAETATGDLEGDVVERSNVWPDRAALVATLEGFRGPIRQVPPAYSALKVAGRRAHALARAGADVVLGARDVTIHDLRLVSFEGADAVLEVSCSKGTYVRSLARDLARAAGSVGTVAALRRTAAGAFREDQAIALDKALELVHGRGLEQALLPLAAGLDDIPVLAVTSADAAHLKAGRRIADPEAKPGLHLATHGSVPVALVEVSQGDIRVVRGLNID